MDLVLAALAVQLTNLAFFVWFQRSTLTRTLALWHQLVVYKRQIPHPVLKNRDRLLWVFLSRLWPKGDDGDSKGWRRALVIVTPETVLRWGDVDFATSFVSDPSPIIPAAPASPGPTSTSSSASRGTTRSTAPRASLSS